MQGRTNGGLRHQPCSLEEHRALQALFSWTLSGALIESPRTSDKERLCLEKEGAIGAPRGPAASLCHK